MNTPTAGYYLPPDTTEAYDAWGANCGPAALAALTRRPVMGLREHCQPWKGYLSFAGMLKALRSVGVGHLVVRRDFKTINETGTVERYPGRLSLIQWGGPWLRAGVHPGAALCRTHWVAVQHNPRAVYDVNSGDWQDFDEWVHVARAIMRETPRSDGTWQIRGSILVEGVS